MSSLFNKTLLPQIYAASTGSLGGLMMGIVLGSLIPGQDKKYASTDGIAFSLGAVVGALPAGVVSANIGPRKAIMLFEAIVVPGWVILMVPTSAMIIAGRVIQGIGIGAMCTVVPTYIAEIAYYNVRGALGSLFQFFSIIGIIYSVAVNSILSPIPFNVSCCLSAFVHIIAMHFMPESPYFLLSKKEEDMAKEAIKKLRRGHVDIMMDELTLAQNDNVERKLWCKANCKSTLIAIGSMFFEKIIGINQLIVFQDDILNSIKKNISFIEQYTVFFIIIILFIQLMMTFVGMSFVDDKIGRRALMSFSSGIMTLSYLILAVCFIFKRNSILDYLIMIFIIVFLSSFSIGYGIVPWIIVGEIFSTEWKPYGTSLAVAVNWATLCVTILVHSAYSLFKLSLLNLFVMYSVVCLFAYAFSSLVMQETKNKSLAEIQEKLEQ